MRVMPKTLAISDRIYTLLLLVYPAPFRREYKEPMAQLFRDECRDAFRQSGITGILGLWLRTFIDLI